MATTNRRSFLKLLGTGVVMGAMPDNIQRALAIPAHYRTGTIEDVEHIIVLMQENRSFDHYFGTLRGVRGFADPRAVTLPSGKPVWYQASVNGELLPFHPDVNNLGQVFLPDPPHGWKDTHAAWNGGRHDQWVPNKGVVSMIYHTREDLPYHFALAEAFTICDAYHCSVLGPTDPNRYHLWTGWLGNDGNAGGPVITNAELGYDWSSFPERLQQSGISWKIYQDIGIGLTKEGSWGWTGDKPYIGNYGDNALLYLHQYQNAQPGEPLADNAKTGTNIAVAGTLFDQFRQDVNSGKLPQVSWIVAPEAYTEHPNWTPNFGAWYISQIIDILTANPEVWSKTALFLNYDEEGGFFDHTIPPTPPQSEEEGASTVDTVNEIYPGDATNPSGPYGLGMRVPMMVISPWSKGGWVNSEVFDHTSVIRFIEARYAKDYSDLIETNITPWRRAVTGDLTTAFNFAKPHAWRLRLPDTMSYQPQDTIIHKDAEIVAPTKQSMPEQEIGIRPARALPYALHAHGTDTGNTFRIEFANTGTATAVFHVRSGHAEDAPRTYTVEPDKTLSGEWQTPIGYHLSVYGPNGFLRAFKGGISGLNRATLDIRAKYDEAWQGIVVTITNRANQSASVRILNKYTGKTIEQLIIAGATFEKHWSMRSVYGWYDLVIKVDEDPDFEYQLAGHIENGKDSISDPAMGGLVSLD